MHYEYAVEPRTIAADWHTCRYISEKFGFDRGRLLSLYPRKWLELAKLAIDETDGLSDIDKKKVIEKLLQLKRNCSIRSNRDYNPDLPEWINNAIAQQAIDPFHAIIAMENPGNEDFILQASDVDDSHPLFSVPHECRIQREAKSLAEAMRLMLKAAHHVLFVDAYYDPFKIEYQNTLRACLGFVRSDSPGLVCEVHHTEYRNGPPTGEIQNNAHEIFRDVIPDGLKLSIYRWREKDCGEDFHARYLLTDIGGIRVDAGFSAEGSHESTDMSLMATEVWQYRMRPFKRDANVYELVEPVLELSANGEITCRRT